MGVEGKQEHPLLALLATTTPAGLNSSMCPVAKRHAKHRCLASPQTLCPWPWGAQDDVQWAVLKPLVFAAIMDHYGSGEPVLSDEATLAASDTAIHEDDDEVCGVWVCVVVVGGGGVGSAVWVVRARRYPFTFFR